MQGTVSLNPAAQQVVERLLAELVSTGQETGIQVAAYHHGDRKSVV